MGRAKSRRTESVRKRKMENATATEERSGQWRRGEDRGGQESRGESKSQEKVKQKEHRKRERKPKRVLVVWLCRCIRTFTSIMLISV